MDIKVIQKRFLKFSKSVIQKLHITYGFHDLSTSQAKSQMLEFQSFATKPSTIIRANFETKCEINIYSIKDKSYS